MSPDLVEIAKKVDAGEPAGEASPGADDVAGDAAPAPPAKEQVHAEPVYGVPWELENNKTAKKLNESLGAALERFLDGDKDTPAVCLVGESAVLTMQQNAGYANLPGHYWLALSLVALAVLVLGARLLGPPPGQGPVPNAPGADIPVTDVRTGEFAGGHVGLPEAA